jgi:putative molybdopterin biosynthesis protein
MEDTPLYQKIVESIRKQILIGQLQPGDRLPSVRQMTVAWDCTPGTVQRAYRELANQGLIVSRAGQGTHVIKAPQTEGNAALRRASLVHRSEAFLLEAMTAGYTPEEVEGAVWQALERWQIQATQPAHALEHTLRFAGSHDPVLAWLAAHFPEIVPKFTLQLGFNGSLGGLIALAQGIADLAGCHLWDEESDSYNEPFVRRMLPGKKVALLTLAHRRLGLIIPKGNPGGVAELQDLARPGLRFVNRQAGSGTRVWLDAALHKKGISGEQILGYEEEHVTHSQVAAAVAEGQADVGFGLEAVALSYGLDFLFLVRERYDLVIPAANLASDPIARLASWLAGEEARRAISVFGGYETGETGTLRWV